MGKRRAHKRNGKPRGGRRGGATKVAGSGFSRPYMEKSRFRSIPREFEIALPYFYHDERTGGQTTQATRRHPLCEFDTTIPRYCAELYQIYRHARIMAIDIHMEVVNTSTTEPLIAVLGVLPLANVSGITDPKQIISVPGTTVRQVGVSQGMSRTAITRRFVTEKMLGELTIGSQTYLQTYSEALSSAVWTELPCIYAGIIAAKIGATWTGIIDYRVTYHLRFSELNVPALGIEDAPPAQPRLVRRIRMHETEPEEEEMGDSDWVKPPSVVNQKRPQLINPNNVSGASLRILK